MRGTIALTLSVVLLGITTGCGRASAPPAAAATSGPPAPADVVDVSCTPTGAQVAATRFAAQRDGVHVRVDNPAGTSGLYLNYRHGPLMNLGGGEPVGSGTVLVLDLPPGPVHLDCTDNQNTRQNRPAAIEVSDPTRAWHAGGLARLGCDPPKYSLIDWAYRPGTGSTADEALTMLNRQLDHPVTWTHAQEGYEAAATQTYVLLRAGKPWVAASVTRSASGTYSTSLGSHCQND